MAIAVLVTAVAAAAAIAAAAHSRKILLDEQTIFPAGTLALGETANVAGADVSVDEADVVEAVASLGTRGFERRTARPDHRYVRLRIAIENPSDKPIDVESLCDTLRLIQTATDKAADGEVVWLRAYYALSPEELPPGERKSGKIAIEVSEFLLPFPFLVAMGDGSARWGVDVIDREAEIEEFM